MSKVAEAYEMYFREEILPPIELLDESELSEKEKCLYYGISCSYGICSECDFTERS